MTRRAWLQRIAAVAVALRWPWSRTPAVTPAMASAMSAPNPTLVAPPFRAFDARTGISMRFIREYDIQADRHPTRMDLYLLDPPFLCR